MKSLVTCISHLGDRVIKSRRIRGEGHVERVERRRAIYRVLVVKVNRPPGRPTRRWEDNIKMDLQGVQCGGMDRIDLAKDRDRWQAILNAVTNCRVP
jgi:hypothetical protein